MKIQETENEEARINQDSTDSSTKTDLQNQ